MRAATTVAAIGLVLLATIASGCGGGSQTMEDNTSGRFSCDTVSGSGGGMVRLCVDYQWEGGVYSSADWKAACTGTGSTESCNHMGAVGGCQIVSYVGGIVITTTNWYYAGRAVDIKPLCTGAWINP